MRPSGLALDVEEMGEWGQVLGFINFVDSRHSICPNWALNQISTLLHVNQMAPLPGMVPKCEREAVNL